MAGNECEPVHAQVARKDTGAWPVSATVCPLGAERGLYAVLGTGEATPAVLCPVLCPHFADTGGLEQVQRTATELGQGLEDKSGEEQLGVGAQLGDKETQEGGDPLALYKS